VLSKQQLRTVLRGEVAKEHNLPGYVIFHDATLATIAEVAPQSLAQLQGISGLGIKKLEAYDPQVLRVCKGRLDHLRTAGQYGFKLNK